jgi:fructose/tagatose bisphosphate aldolase
MLDAAADGGYAYAAINVTSSETLNAALRGFKLANADGIVQLSVGGAAYLSGAAVQDALLGARALARYAHEIAAASPVLVALHTDHCRRRASMIGCCHCWPNPSGVSASAPGPCFNPTCSTARRFRLRRTCG